MGQTFFPTKSLRITASPPHIDAEYIVSIGTEIWGSEPQKVIKVQMAYSGKISGRRSPSYPIGADDYIKVNEAVTTLMSELKE